MALQSAGPWINRCMLTVGKRGAAILSFQAECNVMRERTRCPLPNFLDGCDFIKILLVIRIAVRTMVLSEEATTRSHRRSARGAPEFLIKQCIFDDLDLFQICG